MDLEKIKKKKHGYVQTGNIKEACSQLQYGSYVKHEH
jgi:hypothetical protein